MLITTQAMHQIAKDNGFWSEADRDWSFEGYMIEGQLLHALAELDEYDDAGSTDEAADIVIVIFDLLGALGHRIDICEITVGGESQPYWKSIAQVYDRWRKTGQIMIAPLLDIVGGLLFDIGSITLPEAIEAKSLKNQKRGHLYGVAK